jgi:DNA-binding NarL/FixJ family response regulator
MKVAVADDHPLVISGIHHILTHCPDMEVAGSYTTGAALLKGLETTLPDVLLLDIHMPGMGGDEVADALAEKYPSVKILVLTNEDNIYHIKNMLRRNVCGYLLKTTREDKLLEAIRTVFDGERYIEPALKDKIMQDTLQAKKQVSANMVLSRNEKEVLRLIASDLTSQEIADKLFMSKRTVDAHRLNLLTKLGAKNVASLVKRGLQLGLID